MFELPTIERLLGNAKAFTMDHQLIVETGRVRRAWTWTGAGFATEAVTETVSECVWRGEAVCCDWRMPDGSEPVAAALTALTIEIDNDDGFIPGWATWCLAWSGGDFNRQIAFKTFDRICFPVDPERDVYVQANTWGSSEQARDARMAAVEESTCDLQPAPRCIMSRRMWGMCPAPLLYSPVKKPSRYPGESPP